MSTLSFTFWGVRGSIPVPGPTTIRYGGNTACIEVRSDRDDWVIFDAGTGIRVLGESLDLSKKYDVNILISHPHWDHISGFPFFTPIYIPGNRLTIYGPSTNDLSIEEIFSDQMQYTFFPVRTAELVADITYHELTEEQFTLGNFTIDTIKLNHPVDCLGYRLTYDDTVFVYLGDNEPYYNIYGDGDEDVEAMVQTMNRRLIDFVRGADVLVADSQYTTAEYQNKRGWGHSTTHHLINMSIRAGVSSVFFFHHDPQRTDDDLDRIVQHYRDKLREKGYSLEIDAAREGKTVTR
jgi:phosphoribosyl 1,2-cyclic phosphodiesterase